MPLGVAVSGGADSVALLHILARQRRDLLVLHVNHRLRGAESDADQLFVQQLAAQLNLPFLAHQAPLAIPGNLEQAAREARYRWFHSLVTEAIVEAVATGHTRDDQAETVLFRFLRGAGTAGLVGILPRTAQEIVRPLLHSSRAELRHYLETHQIAWREDTSNNWLRFSRNRIRHELLPHLEAAWNPNLTSALAQTAEWARAEEDYWRHELPRLTANWLRFAESSVCLPVEQLNALPLAAARRVIRLCVEHAAGNTLDLSFPDVERVLALARAPGKMGSFRKKRWLARQSSGQLRIAASPSGPHLLPPATVVVPGSYALPDGRTQLRLERTAGESVYNNDRELADGALLSGSLELRNWLPGDRFHHVGQRTPRKLKNFFQEAGIPSWERLEWPVLTCDNSILWTRRLGVSAQFAASPATVTFLRITESANQNVST